MMKNLKLRKIKQTFLSITLCAGLVWGLLGNKTMIFAAEGFVMPETPYIINLEEATKVGDTYWYHESQVVRIMAPTNYDIATDADATWGATIEVNDTGADFPYQTIFLRDQENGIVSDPIPITEQIAWDSHVPAGVIRDQNGLQWDSLQEQISFATAVEKGSNAATFSITANDEGSGVASVEYYIAGWNLIENPSMPAPEQIEAVVGSDWISYTNGQTITLTQHGENVIYVKITDYVGNTEYICSGGVVLYEQASVNVSDITYTKGEGNNPFFQVSLNGNQYDGDLILKDESGNTVAGFSQKEDENDANWGYQSADGSITLNSAFLDTLAVDGKDAKYTLTINYLALEDIYLDLQNSTTEVTIAPSTVNLTIKNPAPDLSHWGEETTRVDGKIQYVDATGKISMEISSGNADDGLIWLAEQSEGVKSWFGLDASTGVVAIDQYNRFYVQWLKEDDNEYTQLYKQLDENVRADIEDDRVWIFHVGVEDLDGAKVQPSGSVKLYVQFDGSWDAQDIRAYNIATGQDEAVSVEIVKNVPYAEGTTDFAVLELLHFSPYMIFDQETTGTVPPGSGEGDAEQDPNTGGEGDAEQDPSTGGEGDAEQNPSEDDLTIPSPGGEAEPSGNPAEYYYHFATMLSPKTGEVNYLPMMMLFSAGIFLWVGMRKKTQK